MSESPPFPDEYAEASYALLQRSHLVAPDRLPDLVARCAERLGAVETVLYLVDYEQESLLPVRGTGATARQPIRIDTTLAGNAFRRITPLTSDVEGVVRLFVPLLDGADRLGVAEYVLVGDAEVDADRLAAISQFSHLVAELLLTKAVYTDTYEWTRRRQRMTVAAEMQYNSLPPLTFGTERVVISGLLAPAYEVGGDLFDYAVNGSVAHVAVMDAMGHGLEAARLSTLAVGAYRNARRAGLELADTALAVDAAIDSQHAGERFVTAILGQLDLDEGRIRWLSCGHPAPLLLRDSRVVSTLAMDPGQPLGLLGLAGGTAPPVQEDHLQPGDRLLLFTDGVDEARGRDGSFFGMQRLAEFVARQSASGEPTPEVLRRLQRAVLEHQEGRLQDDATTLFVEWRTGRERHLTL